MTSASPALGAYGLRVTGIGAGHELLGPVRDHFPPLHMAYREEPRHFDTSSIDDDRAAFALHHGSGLLVDRETACATYSGPRRPTAADTVHPLLTAAAAAIGRWSGYEQFHAAAFVADGRVWGLLGDKESGKSTLAAWLAQHGVPVLCDDMLAVSGRTAFAGPRCVDLRPEPARKLGIGEQADTDGPRPRWRVTLPPIDAELVLGGWVLLTWADAVESVPLGPRKLLGCLAANRTWRGLPTDPVGLLDLAALPAWELRRPPSWASFHPAAAALEAATIKRRGRATTLSGGGASTMSTVDQPGRRA